MRLSTVTITLVGLTTTTLAAPGNSKHVKFPFTKSTNVLNSRDPTNPSISIGNAAVYYSIRPSYGTPPQSFEVLLDTGSSDAWVRADGSPGSFERSKSSTYQQYLPGDFDIVYYGKNYATGDFVKDTLHVGDVTLDNFIFGLANHTVGPQIFGIGLKGTESTKSGIRYDNFPAQLAKQGYTNTNAYSLYCTLLMGAVDTSKIEDGLVLLPLLKEHTWDEVPARFLVTLDSIEFAGGANALPQPRRVLLDSGTYNTVLPTYTYWQLFHSLGLHWTSAGPVASQSQYDKWTTDKTSLTYTLQGKKVNVPLAQLFMPRSDYVTTSKGQERAYRWPVQDNKTNNGWFILGETFLRSAYVTYDLTNYRVGLGQAKYDDSEEKIEAISSGGIPSATSASVAAWSTDYPITGTVATPTSTASLGPKTQ